MDVRPSSFARVAMLATAVALAAFALFAVFHFKRESLPVPGCPVFGYDVSGLVVNRLTGERIAAAELDCGGCRATSDAWGQFTIKFTRQGSQRCRVSARGFEVASVDGHVGRPLGVWLAPDPLATVDLILNWEQRAEYERQYDLLYPDLKRSWTKEEYSRLMRLTQERRILNVEYAAPARLQSWDYFGDVFNNVIVVPTWITFERPGGRVRSYWEAHLIQVDGVWHWFGEPGA